MKHISMIRMLATALLSIAAFTGCSSAADGSSVQAGSVQDRAFGPETREPADELTPAERRLEWVRRPAKSQTAALDTRLSADASSPGAR
jgi:hypothetical protein